MSTSRRGITRIPPAFLKRATEHKIRPHQSIFYGTKHYLEKTGSQFHHICGHRQMGKTTGVSFGVQKDVVDIYNEESIYKITKDVDSWNPEVAFLAETQKQARSLVWENFKMYLSIFNKYKPDNRDYSISIPRPHIGDRIKIQIMALRNHNRVRGHAFRKIYLDEAQNLNEESFSKSIHATLASCRGVGTTTGTARPEGYYRNMILRAHRLGYPVHIIPAFDPKRNFNTGVFTEEELRQKEAEMGYYAFRQEYLCDFNIPSKGAFFSKELIRLEGQDHFYRAEFNPANPIIIAFDIGISEGLAFWVTQINDGWLDCLDYFDDYEAAIDVRNDIEEAGYKVSGFAVPHDSTTRKFETHQARTFIDVIRDIWPELPRPKPVERPKNKSATIMESRDNLKGCRFPSPLHVEGPLGSTDAYRGLQKLKNFSAVVDKDGIITDRIDKTSGNDHCADALMTAMQFYRMRQGKVGRVPQTLAPDSEPLILTNLSRQGSIFHLRQQQALKQEQSRRGMMERQARLAGIGR